jgi:hypothetical protein
LDIEALRAALARLENFFARRITSSKYFYKNIWIYIFLFGRASAFLYEVNYAFYLIIIQENIH